MTKVSMNGVSTDGWLVAQLPLAMRDQLIIDGLVRTAEEVVDPVRDQLDALAAMLDPRTAPPALLCYLASWFGFTLDPADDEVLLRRLVAGLGPIVARRGTPGALAELAELLTGGPVRVHETGGVWAPGGTVAEATGVVRVEVAQVGPLGADRVRALLAREVPIGVRLEMVGGP